MRRRRNCVEKHLAWYSVSTRPSAKIGVNVNRGRLKREGECRHKIQPSFRLVPDQPFHEMMPQRLEAPLGTLGE